MPIPPWIDSLVGGVTVIDAEGTIVAMNAMAAKQFADKGGAALIGKSVFDCHNEASCAKLRELLSTRGTNTYTVEKAGKRRLIHQAPWYDGERYGGMIEIVLPIPAEMPHHVRG